MASKTAEGFLGLLRRGALAAGAGVVVAILACGTGTLNLTSLAGTACTSGVPTQWYQNGDSACTSCVSRYCASEQKCIPTSCATYGQCYCACGIGDLACYSACQPDLSSDCTSCEGTVSTCVTMRCEAECGDGGAPSGSSSGSSGGAPEGICSTLEKCCKLQTGAALQVCTEVAQNNDDAVCQAAYAGLIDGGDCRLDASVK